MLPRSFFLPQSPRVLAPPCASIPLPRTSSRDAASPAASTATPRATRGPESPPAPRLAFMPLEPDSEATLRDAEAPGSFLWDQPPFWRVLLLSDGSVTRHLKLITGGETIVECFDMHVLDPKHEVGPVTRPLSPSSSSGDPSPRPPIPPETSQLAGPLLQRQVFLRDPRSGEALVYAASWWNAEEADRHLKDRNKSMWRSLADGHMELYRDIGRVVRGTQPALEEHFGGRPGPYWGRYYTFWTGGKPLTVVYEAFSPALEHLI